MLETFEQRVSAADEMASISNSSEFEQEIFTEVAILLQKFSPILLDIKENDRLMGRPPVRKEIGLIEKGLKHVQDLLKCTPNSRHPIKQMEMLIQDLGRSLGLVLFASIDANTEIKQKISALHKELITVKFDSSFSPSPSPSPSADSVLSAIQEHEFGSVSELHSEIEIEEERVVLTSDDVVWHLKYGDDEEFRFALLVLRDFIKDRVVDKEWIDEEDIVPIIFNKLSSNKPNSRLIIIQILKILSLESAENKEKMGDVNCLSALVKSLTRDVDEQREAVGLLLEISNISAVRRRIGRIQGCVVMLVSILNGEDPTASHDAGKLLVALSSNTQNVLHMAEAGYFRALVKCLKEGSDMSRILMATALSRMELTNQSRASLGEDGAVEPLVKMFKEGKLEAKLSALNALQNLADLTENIQRVIAAGIVVPLLQLLFSVTSVLMTLREPASAILAKIARSESILVNHDVAQQMFSLLHLSSPVIQHHLLEALNSIASHPSASKVRRKMTENGAVQLLVPFLTENRIKTRTAALNLMYTLSKDSPDELAEQLGESQLSSIVRIVSSSTSESEKAAALGLISTLPLSNKKSTEILLKSNLLPVLLSTMDSSASASTGETSLLEESISGILIRFTVPSDWKLQLYSGEVGVVPLLVKLLSNESSVVKSRAATALSQLSQNSVTLRKSQKSRWVCMPHSSDAFCEVHEGFCSVRSTFCLVKAGAVSPLIRILESNDTEADEAALIALATLLQDEIWERGSNCIAKSGGVPAVVQVLESGNVKGQEKALWILERVFRVEVYRAEYGESAQAVLIDLAQNGEPRLKSTAAKVLGLLDVLQAQSSYF